MVFFLLAWPTNSHILFGLQYTWLQYPKWPRGEMKARLLMMYSILVRFPLHCQKRPLESGFQVVKEQQFWVCNCRGLWVRYNPTRCRVLNPNILDYCSPASTNSPLSFPPFFSFTFFNFANWHFFQSVSKFLMAHLCRESLKSSDLPRPSLQIDSHHRPLAFASAGREKKTLSSPTLPPRLNSV